ncbi:MAG: hypothetical protein M3R72_10775 [Bacteroidota bacterium]|nr:hypothetical protein [Bacteroidota bacterium]
MQGEKLSRLMVLSWEIQRSKKCGRSKALLSAWAILSNEDITVYYLVKKYSHNNAIYPNKVGASNLSLFKQQEQ